ncbi:divergent polysaccharide deacetylase family protein [Parvibaculum sp.]|uniref:divergent polysaccharide deacetylase family protein n=1 Tax=Parvibaculum sp. TaxID=2024848 RepID=UPI001B0F5701|nr:divergent polysaccharide deacetylase family protein [Parvibaculum sp.]MBO6633367.1 divergent polysaccharide deacetylase family protein [Parvibaculum sp.]MBO6677230.1 divergent polysaccharide deacetylase family protein [Parvibaculum sp.]MBO6686074.1 divergent polysaccharide deacetylase family protein [Parvibaculum sp.]MBO6904490.1 divergent polysaccharide deacetylase family protein [Parvibaculum sp.]
MVAKIAANGSGPIRHSDEDSGGLAGRLLAAAALLVVLVYGGTLAWLLLSDDRLAGEPVVRVALAPEEPVAPESPAEEETQTPLAEITPDEQEPPEGDVADLSADEQALLDAARNLDGGGETEGEVRIVGAESVSGDGGEETGSEGEVIRLDPIPDPALVEQTADGPLPKISRDGRKPWQVYARPVPSGTQSDRRIALVVSGMGISESATAHAIKVLPPEVTLSFAPYGAGLQEWIARARAAGHEVLLELPMEPFGYPQNDPGPHTLLTGGNTDENISRLEWLMSRFTGYTGVMNYQGARFTTSASALTPVMGALGARGLLYVDNGASARSLAPELAEKAGMPAVQATRIVDPVQNPEVIATSLDTLEDVAREKGSAVGVASGFPVTVDALVQWAASLKDEGYVLVPVTAIATDN